ncbi:hypothetical protein [Pedobacter immunditicola]|uniref:hypothetical protein n=1 Tax=Pedobacter immunditicola TaxID=3133440 RepID=UPI0030B4A174
MKSENNRNSFRDSLDVEKDHSGSMDNDWSMLEQRLGRHDNRRKTMLWTKVLSAAAAVLLLLLAWWLFQPNDAVKPEQEIVKEKPVPEESPGEEQGIPALPESQPDQRQQVTPEKQQQYGFQPTITDTENKHSEFKPAGEENRLPFDQNPPVILDASTAFKSNLDEKQIVIKLDSVKPVAPQLQPEKVTTASLKPQSPQLTLSVIYAPAINGVNNLSNAKVGSDVGLLFTVGLTKKISVTTGAIYAKKLYESSFNEYNPNYKPSLAVDPQSVSADCRVLDIPLNINYSLMNKGKNSLTIGTGLSSYLMLKENYRYVYSTEYNNPQYNYSLSNRNKHWFGVINVEARYQRQISPKFGIGLQPYMKIPISDIGYGNVKLQSLGMAVNLNWNIRAYSKKDK